MSVFLTFKTLLRNRVSDSAQQMEGEMEIMIYVIQFFAPLNRHKKKQNISTNLMKGIKMSKLCGQIMAIIWPILSHALGFNKFWVECIQKPLWVLLQILKLMFLDFYLQCYKRQFFLNFLSQVQLNHCVVFRGVSLNCFYALFYKDIFCKHEVYFHALRICDMWGMIFL